MPDAFQYHQKGLDSPFGDIALVTPSDSTVLDTTRGISFATAGALAVVTESGQTVTIPNGALAAGVIHRLRVTKVLSTGTGASNIVAYR